MNPRLGFLGLGWIGRHRLDAVLRSGIGEVVAIHDPSPSAVEEALRLAPRARATPRMEDLFEERLQGLVVATPSGLHAEQCEAALSRGVAVFCQKPLGRNETETRALVERARAGGLLLGVDLSYRRVKAVRAAVDLVRSGELGRVYAAELVFHNAYGPDKPWFYDRRRSGGGCVIDLGIHLVDLVLWALGFPAVADVRSRLFAKGDVLDSGTAAAVEDFAEVRLDVEGGAVARVSCSWNLPAGCDAVIAATFYGTRGGACVRNVDGSFYDFTAEHFLGTHRRHLAGPPDEWGGRALVEWVGRLAAGERFDPSAEEFVRVAEVLDRVYRSPV